MCGYAFYGKPTWFHKNDLFYVYYRCAGTDPYRAGGKRVCGNKVIRGEFLEQIVWEAVTHDLRDPSSLEEE